MTRVPIQVGIVGAGLMGRWHAHAAQRAGGRVSAVMDLDERVALGLAKHYPAAMVFANLEEMLITSPQDVIHICSPKSTHYSIAELAIKAGCHLLIEKPMTSTAAETERLLELAAERGLCVSPVHQFLFQDGVLKARRLLPGIGRLVDICAVVVSAGGIGFPDDALDDLVADILPHPLSLIQFFLPGNFSEVSWSTISSRRGELRVVGEVSDITLSVFISMNARPTANLLALRGEQGTIHVNLFHGYSFIESGSVSRRRKITQPFERSLKNSAFAAVNLGRRLFRSETAYPGLQRLVRSFYDTLERDARPPISRTDTNEVARVRDDLMNLAGLAVETQRT